MENIIQSLLGDRSLAIASLLLGNLALSWALVQTWRWHRREREEDRARWIAELERHNEILGRLTDVLTDLRVLIAQAPPPTNNGRAGGRR